MGFFHKTIMQVADFLKHSQNIQSFLKHKTKVFFVKQDFYSPKNFTLNYVNKIRI